MKNAFENFLIEKGYSLVTPSGNPSTVYDYIKRIDKICKWEDKTWQELVDDIDAVLSQYDVGGVKEEYGNKSHNAVINALRRFKEFIDSTQ